MGYFYEADGLPVDDHPEVPWAHCCECGDPIFKPKRRRCNICAAAKFGEA